jgi:hypothetical protein
MHASRAVFSALQLDTTEIEGRHVKGVGGRVGLLIRDVTYEIHIKSNKGGYCER